MLMPLFELRHRFVHYPNREGSDANHPALKTIADELNAGWEIVSATPVTDALGNIKTVVYVLKRVVDTIR